MGKIDNKEEERKWTVYVHENKVNGKRYVGITSQKPEDRWRDGAGYSRQIFGFAITKYGWDGFEHKILFCNLTENEAKAKEIELIDKYDSIKNGYNLTEGGEGTLGRMVSDETRSRISASLKDRYTDKTKHGRYGKINTQQSKDKNRESQLGEKSYCYGKKWTEDRKKKLSNSNKGRRLSEETKRKLSDNRRGKYTYGNCYNSKIVLCDGYIYDSIKRCSEVYGVKQSTFRSWVNGSNPMPQKYIDLGLRYVTQEEIDEYIASKEIEKAS